VRKLLFELQGNALSHYANSINRIDERIGIAIQKIAGEEPYHLSYFKWLCPEIFKVEEKSPVKKHPFPEQLP